MKAKHISKLEVLHEDEAIVVVNKPPKMLTVPDRFAHDLPSVYKWLQRDREEVFIVHRLDKETSGVICFAKTAAAHKNLCQQFENRGPVKIYHALADGCFSEQEGTIECNLAKDLSTPGKMCVQKKGKHSRTDYKVLEEFKFYSLVEANIKTGRQHQIRVHFAHIGHPLAIDKMYNHKKSEFYLSQIKRKLNKGKFEEERPLMSRTTLHAAYLKLTHPTTGEQVEFSAPFPKDFKAVMAQLRKHNKQ